MCGRSDGGVCYVSERVMCVVIVMVVFVMSVNVWCVCGRSDDGVCYVCYVRERVLCVVVVMMVFVMSVNVWCVWL